MVAVRARTAEEVRIGSTSQDAVTPMAAPTAIAASRVCSKSPGLRPNQS